MHQKFKQAGLENIHTYREIDINIYFVKSPILFYVLDQKIIHTVISLLPGGMLCKGTNVLHAEQQLIRHSRNMCNFPSNFLCTYMIL